MEKKSDGGAVQVDNKRTGMSQRQEGNQDHGNDNVPMDDSEAPEGALHVDGHPGMERVNEGDLRRVPMGYALGIACAMVRNREENGPPICAHAPSFLPGVACSILPASSADEDRLEAALSDGYKAALRIPRLVETESVNDSTREVLLMIAGPLQRHVVAILAIAELLIANGHVHAHEVVDAMQELGGRDVEMAGSSPEFLRESSGEPLPKVPRENLWIIHKAPRGAKRGVTHPNVVKHGRSHKK